MKVKTFYRSAVKPVYGPKGDVVGWASRDLLMDLSGQYRAYIVGEAVHGLDGEQRGWLTRGYLRSRDGSPVAFVDGAEGGPQLPVRHAPPVPPMPGPPPERPKTASAGPVPVRKLSWSAMTYDELISAPVAESGAAS